MQIVSAKLCRKIYLLLNILSIPMQLKTRMSIMNMKVNIKHSNKIKFLTKIFNFKIYMKLAVTEIITQSKTTILRQIHFLKTTKQ